jgi:hypothetical protein
MCSVRRPGRQNLNLEIVNSAMRILKLYACNKFWRAGLTNLKKSASHIHKNGIRSACIVPGKGVSASHKNTLNLGSPPVADRTAVAPAAKRVKNVF